MKNVFIGLLTTLFLPIAAILSFLLIALLVAAMIVFSPLLILGGTIISSTYLSEKITEWLFPMKGSNSIKTVSKNEKASIFTSLSLTLIFIPLTALPVAIGEVILIAIAAPLSIPVLAVMAAFKSAEKIVNKIFPEPMNIYPIQHSYHLLSTETQKPPYFSSEQDKIVSLYQKSPKRAVKTAKIEESSSLSRGLNFFMPLLKCLSSLGNCTDSTEEEHPHPMTPSFNSSSNDSSSK